MLSDDLPPRRPLFFPVVVATVFLTIIGMSAGLVLGFRAKQQAPDQVRVIAPSAAVTAPGDARAPCPPPTQAKGARAGANGVLRTVLQVRTASSTVWICADVDERLFYHANRGGADAAWVEGKTALFLSGVVRSDDGYQATATDAEGSLIVFDVTRKHVHIRHPGGRTERQPVRAVVAG